MLQEFSYFTVTPHLELGYRSASLKFTYGLIQGAKNLALVETYLNSNDFHPGRVVAFTPGLINSEKAITVLITDDLLTPENQGKSTTSSQDDFLIEMH